MAKRILILGGSYFAGRALVSRLAEETRHEIFVFNRGNIPLGIEGVRQMKGDRCRFEDLKEAISFLDWDVLIDFCGYSPEDIQCVFDAAGSSIRQYIFISSTSVYDHSRTIPMSEDSRFVKEPAAHLGEFAQYAFQKVLAEKTVVDCCQKARCAYTILRPTIIYGPFNYAPRENYFFDRIDAGQPVVIPKDNLSLFSFIFVEDLAGIIMCCMEQGDTKNNVFNVAAPEQFNYRRYAQVLQKIVPGKIQIMEADIAQIIRLKIELPFPVDHHQVYSTDHLEQICDIEFTPLEKGLEKTFRFYQYLKLKNREAQNGCV